MNGREWLFFGRIQYNVWPNAFITNWGWWWWWCTQSVQVDEKVFWILIGIWFGFFLFLFFPCSVFIRISNVQEFSVCFFLFFVFSAWKVKNALGHLKVMAKRAAFYFVHLHSSDCMIRSTELKQMQLTRTTKPPNVDDKVQQANKELSLGCSHKLGSSQQEIVEFHAKCATIFSLFTFADFSVSDMNAQKRSSTDLDLSTHCLPCLPQCSCATNTDVHAVKSRKWKCTY